MTCEEVKISLHDYIDEHLDLLEKKEIEAHLRGCDKCHNEITRLRNYFNTIKSIPYTIEAPEEIIQKFSRDLISLSREEPGGKNTSFAFEDEKIRKEQKKFEKKLKSERGPSRKSDVSATIVRNSTGGFKSLSYIEWKKFIIMPVLIAAGFAGYFIYDFQKYNSPWDIQLKTGTAIVNGRLNSTGKISQGESLSLDKQSVAVIEVPNTGNVEVNSSSYIVLEEAKNGANRIRVKEGSIRVVNSADIPDLRITVNSSLITDKSGIFTVDIDEASNAKINVEKGYLEIPSVRGSYNLAAGYMCEIKNNHSPGTPYRIDAADTLKNEVDRFDYYNGGDLSVRNIISIAGKKDMLTLLAMIPAVSQLQRQILFQSIANHFPPPTSVTRLGIMKADGEMLYKWWEEIVWQLQ
jgi:hypothetical protein